MVSIFDWAGCAAPKACIPCESAELIVDENYVENEVCKPHHFHLNPGQMDMDSFKCLSGDKCIQSSGRCNGVDNCQDGFDGGSDELGCETEWGVPAFLGTQDCQTPVNSDVQWTCADNSCIHVAGRCNGVNNCADGSDEAGCPTTTQGVTVEAMTGFSATIVTPQVQDVVFTDRRYHFDSLGSFTGHSYVKMHNDDKHIRHSHVQMKLRFEHPTVVYVVKLDTHELPWLASEGWLASSLTGVSYYGTRETRHTEWSEVVHEERFGPGEVYQKTFPAGAVEMRGNSGGDGSYIIFVANPAHTPAPPAVDLWRPVLGSERGERVKCNNNIDLVYVADQAMCQRHAIANGHPFYSFRHNAGGQGHKCMSSSHCDSHLTDRLNEWHIYATETYHYGAPGANACETNAVSEAECLAAVEALPHDLAGGSLGAQGRLTLVAGSWPHVPPGCSVQSHFSTAYNHWGDWAAHYNRNSGGRNDGGYTPVCLAHSTNALPTGEEVVFEPVMKAVTNLFTYDSAYWENTETLNPTSNLDQAEDAKYPAFMTATFNVIRMCVGGPATQCMDHRLGFTWNSAHDLFTAGDIRDESIDQGAWLSAFEAGNRGNVLCPMQKAGFNSRCKDGNRVRFGWCNNIHTQACQSEDHNDADGVIGIGLHGQGGGHTGAGHTNGFANNDVTSGTERTIPTWIYVGYEAPVSPAVHHGVLVMKAVTDLFNYNSPYWENTDTLHPNSAVESAQDAKYPAFMTERFNSITMCVGGPFASCVEHRLQSHYESARDLFSAGFIRDESIDQAAWLAAFDAGNRGNVLCPMQRPGFNSQCRDSNKVRFGWCNNIYGQGCQSGDNNDADGTIGLGLWGQGGGHTGAGHTNGFANNGVGASTERTIPTWIYVQSV
jgi:hypothetical protein